MKKLIIAAAFALLFSFTFDLEAQSSKQKDKKEKSWKSEKSKKSVPIDGGLSIFLLAAGAIGISALKKRKITA